MVKLHSHWLAIAWATAGVLVGAQSASAVLVGFEAETFNGSDFTVVADPTASGGAYATTTVDRQISAPPQEVVTYDLNLPTAGTYFLYGRILVPPPESNDGSRDSLFIPDSFGATPGWELVNGLSLDGPADEVYRWVNLSDEASQNYTTTGGPVTFAIGGREGGLQIDGFVLATESGLGGAELLDALQTTPPPGPGDTIPEPVTASMALGAFGLLLARRRR